MMNDGWFYAKFYHHFYCFSTLDVTHVLYYLNISLIKIYKYPPNSYSSIVRMKSTSMPKVRTGLDLDYGKI